MIVDARPASGPGWRDFRLRWSGQSASRVGDLILMLALPLAAAQELGAGTIEVGRLAASTRLPNLLIGPPAGWVVRVGPEASPAQAGKRGHGPRDRNHLPNR